MMRNEFSNKVRRRRKNNKTKICDALGTYVRHASTLLVGCPVPSDSLPTNAAKLKLYANDVVENEIYINHFWFQSIGKWNFCFSELQWKWNGFREFCVVVAVVLSSVESLFLHAFQWVIVSCLFENIGYSRARSNSCLFVLRTYLLIRIRNLLEISIKRANEFNILCLSSNLSDSSTGYVRLLGSFFTVVIVDGISFVFDAISFVLAAFWLLLLFWLLLWLWLLLISWNGESPHKQAQCRGTVQLLFISPCPQVYTTA